MAVIFLLLKKCKTALGAFQIKTTSVAVFVRERLSRFTFLKIRCLTPASSGQACPLRRKDAGPHVSPCGGFSKEAFDVLTALLVLLLGRRLGGHLAASVGPVEVYCIMGALREAGLTVALSTHLGRKLPDAVAHFRFLTGLTHQLVFLAVMVIKVSSRLLPTTPPTSPLKTKFFYSVISYY